MSCTHRINSATHPWMVLRPSLALMPLMFSPQKFVVHRDEKCDVMVLKEANNLSQETAGELKGGVAMECHTSLSKGTARKAVRPVLRRLDPRSAERFPARPSNWEAI